jgi:hypothetical protein
MADTHGIGGTEGLAELAPPTADLCFGGTNGVKRVHHATCRHARRPYHWARCFLTVRGLCESLVLSGAWRWHRFCHYCCQEFIDEMNDAMTRDYGDA